MTLCLKFLWQQRVGQLLRNSKKKNNRIYSHLNFFLSHSFPTICSPRPFVRICGLPSLCSGLFSFSSSVCFTGILVSKQPLWFHISTFAMDLCVYFVHVWSKCSFLSGFFFFLSENILQLQQYETHHMKQTKLCVADGRKTYYSNVTQSEIQAWYFHYKLHKYTHLHVCWITVPHKLGLR